MTTLLSLWVMVNLRGSLCEVKKRKENVPCTVFCKVRSLPFFFFPLFVDKRTEKKIGGVALDAWQSAVCAPAEVSAHAPLRKEH